MQVDSQMLFVSTWLGSAYVTINQSYNEGVPPVINDIYNVKSSTTDTDSENHRKHHVIQFTATNCIPLLYDIIPHLTLKRDQARLVYDWLLGHEHVTLLETQLLVEQLKVMKLTSTYQRVEINVPQLSDEYIAGFFDAEGCVQVTSVAAVRLQFSLSK
jgi:hypothetical protein